MAQNEDLCADWDVIFDDRGHFEEPHGGKVIGLGTLSVRAYLEWNHDLAIEGAGFKEVEIETHGADGRFGALLFIEKEGFNETFKAAKLAEKFDIGIPLQEEGIRRCRSGSSISLHVAVRGPTRSPCPTILRTSGARMEHTTVSGMAEVVIVLTW